MTDVFEVKNKYKLEVYAELQPEDILLLAVTVLRHYGYEVLPADIEDEENYLDDLK